MDTPNEELYRKLLAEEELTEEEIEQATEGMLQAFETVFGERPGPEVKING